MRRRILTALRLSVLSSMLAASVSAVAGTSDTEPMSIDRIIAERVKVAQAVDAPAALPVVDDARVGLFGAASGIPIDALRQTRSVRDLDVLLRFKFARLSPHEAFRLGGVAALAAGIVSASVSNQVTQRDNALQLPYYPASQADNAPIATGDDPAIAAQLAKLVSAGGCEARAVALLRRIAAGPGEGRVTAATLDARRVLKRLGSGAYHPIDQCEGPEGDMGYIATLAAAS